VSCEVGLWDELFVADQADLGHAKTLGTGHYVRHHLVLNQLVRAQVHCPLIGRGRHALQLGMQRAIVDGRSIRQHLPSKSMSIVMTSGCFVLGGGFPTGMFRLTA